MNLCDACHVAKATHTATKGTQSLNFCTHHFNRHELALSIWADSLKSLDKLPAMV